jgi:hypothetical protein
LPFSRLKPEAAIAVELTRGAVTTADAIWIPQPATGAVVRIGAKNTTPDKPIVLGKPACASLLQAFESLWVPLCESGTIVRVHQKHANVSASAPIRVAEPNGTIAVAAQSVWAITDPKGVVSRIDPDTNSPVAEVYVAARPFAIAAADDIVWVTSEAGDTLTRIDARTNIVRETITVGPRPGLVAIGEGAVWTLNRGDGSVSRVDPKTDKVVNTIKIDASVGEGSLAVGEGAVWLSAPGVPLVRIDIRTNRLTHKFTGDRGGAVVVGHGSVWVNAGPQTTWRIDPKLVAAIRP